MNEVPDSMAHTGSIDSELTKARQVEDRMGFKKFDYPPGYWDPLIPEGQPVYPPYPSSETIPPLEESEEFEDLTEIVEKLLDVPNIRQKLIDMFAQADREAREGKN